MARKWKPSKNATLAGVFLLNKTHTMTINNSDEPIDEPIKKAISSQDTDGCTYIIYKDGGLKIIQEGNENNTAMTVYIPFEEMQEIIAAIAAP